MTGLTRVTDELMWIEYLETSNLGKVESVLSSISSREKKLIIMPTAWYYR